MAPWHISSSRAHSDKIPTATRIFSGSSFLVRSSTADVMGRRCVLEIQDGRQITGSKINFADLQIHMSFQKQYRGL